MVFQVIDEKEPKYSNNINASAMNLTASFSSSSPASKIEEDEDPFVLH
jgi:hypothetical protein